MRKVLILLLLVLPWTMGGLAAQDTIDEKLRELEKRIEELEERSRGEADSEEPETDRTMTVEVEELRRQLDILAEEIERIRSGEETVPLSPQEAQAKGLGASASRVYEETQGVSIAGYGEMVYENYNDENEGGAAVDRTSQLDFLRAILYAGYRFNDRFLFNSELEVEHSSTGETGSVSMEFAYLEYLLNDNFSLRGGLLLVPMGLVNEFHEPNAFFGALRPQTERVILPSTWRENGFGVLGDVGPVSFRAYLVNGLDAAGFSSSGLRGGRQKGSRSKAEDFGFVGRVDVAPTPGFFFGGSVYRGGSDQGQFELDGSTLDVGTTIWEVHGQAQFQGWDFRGLFAQAHLDDVRELNLARGLDPNNAIAEQMRGGYLQAAYNVLTYVSEDMALSPYYRFEAVDTQNQMPVGFFANPARDSTFHTLGLEFKPIYNIVIKGDYQWNRNDAESGVDQFNIGLGYSF